MTDTDAPSTMANPRTRMIIIAVLVVVVIAGGSFVAYKLTNKKEVAPPASQAATKVKKALIAGDRSTVVANSTPKGATQLEALKPAELRGLTFGSCTVVPALLVKTKVCTFTRPGGQLTMTLIRRPDKWWVDAASVGPAGLPPTSVTSPTT